MPPPSSPGWPGGSPNWNEGWTGSNAADPSPADPTGSFGPPDRALIAGIAAYRRHPYQRDLPDPPALWRAGGARLLDYGAEGDAEGRGTSPAVLFVPSLVNRAQVLDLMPGHSLLRWLAGRGVRPLLLDWGWPGAEERGFGLSDYVARRLEPALEAAAGAAGRGVALAGYCMGGLLALAAALRRPELARGLALLATPWDFHAPDPAPALRLAAALPWLEPVLRETGTLPVDVLQAGFAGADPGRIARKYRAFADMPQDGDRARLFVAIEDWVNDGIPLAAPVARACLADWYGANLPGRGLWRVDGRAVDPRALRLPGLVVVPKRDRLVPEACALPLARLFPGAALHRPGGRHGAGHVGMVAGPGAETGLWPVLLEWLRGVD